MKRFLVFLLAILLLLGITGQASALQLLEFKQVALPGDPLDVADTATNPYVVSGFTVTYSGSTATVAAGTAYNFKKWMLPSSTTFTATDTGAAHSEYIKIDTKGKLTMGTTSPGSTDLAIATVAVDATGAITEVTDTRRVGLNLGEHTDGAIFVPPQNIHISGTATLTRNASGNWSINQGASSTVYYMIPLSPWFRTTSGKGVKITSVDISYMISGAALTTHSYAAQSTTYANNTANAVAAFGGTWTGTLETAIQTNPYLTTLTPGTPAWFNTADAFVHLELTVTTAAGGAYRLQGAYIKYTYNKD